MVGITRNKVILVISTNINHKPQLRIPYPHMACQIGQMMIKQSGLRGILLQLFHDPLGMFGLNSFHTILIHNTSPYHPCVNQIFPRNLTLWWLPSQVSDHGGFQHVATILWWCRISSIRSNVVKRIINHPRNHHK